MVVVIDTNVMLVSPLEHSPTYPIITGLIQGALQLCVTDEIVYEYEEIFTKKLGHKFSSKYLDFIFKLPKTRYISPYFNWRLISEDPDDNKFVDCAIAANADYIITEDRHFDVLHSIDFPKVAPIGALDFIQKFLK